MHFVIKIANIFHKKQEIKHLNKLIKYSNHDININNS